MRDGGHERAGEGERSPPTLDIDRSSPASDADPEDPSGALAVLTRELYWAGDPLTRSLDTGSVRERLHAFAQRLRVEAWELYPVSEPGLDRAPRLRRRTKRGLWYLSRFATRRYDRLLGELAELNVQLAERLADTERELERLRAEHEDRGAGA